MSGRQKVITYEQFKELFDKACGKDEKNKEIFDYMVYSMKKKTDNEKAINEMSGDYLFEVIDEYNIQGIQEKLQEIKEKYPKGIIKVFRNRKKVSKEFFKDQLNKGGIQFEESELKQFVFNYQKRDEDSEDMDLTLLEQDIKGNSIVQQNKEDSIIQRKSQNFEENKEEKEDQKDGNAEKKEENEKKNKEDELEEL